MFWPLRFAGDDSAARQRANLLRRSIGSFGLALVVATWPLWTPQQVFPQVPFLGLVGALPDAVQWFGTLCMVLGLVASLLTGSGSRAASGGLLLFAGAAVVLILFDQARLQPWAYQFVLLALVLAVAEARLALSLLRLLIVSFYFHSAVTKLDYTFLHTLGQQFLQVLAGFAGASSEHWNASTRLALAAVFPVGELLVAVGLCFARTRRATVVGAVVLHLVLLAILGPAGLDHKPGVLIWNLFFIVQAVLLFWPTREAQAGTATERAASARPRGAAMAVSVLIGAATVLPFLAPTAWFDLWPAWGLYAPAAERVQLLVHRRELEQLPDDLRMHAEQLPEADEGWFVLRLDRWALAALGAPLYPQNRYQLGVAEAVVTRYGLVHRVRVQRLGLADRWDGSRTTDRFATLDELLAAGPGYLLNTRPTQARFAPNAGT